MSSSTGLSSYQIRKLGWQALTERLGVSGAIRFLMQYDPGIGDYTRERKELLADVTFEKAVEWMASRAENP